MNFLSPPSSTRAASSSSPPLPVRPSFARSTSQQTSQDSARYLGPIIGPPHSPQGASMPPARAKAVLLPAPGQAAPTSALTTSRKLQHSKDDIGFWSTLYSQHHIHTRQDDPRSDEALATLVAASAIDNHGPIKVWQVLTKTLVTNPPASTLAQHIPSHYQQYHHRHQQSTHFDRLPVRVRTSASAFSPQGAPLSIVFFFTVENVPATLWYLESTYTKSVTLHEHMEIMGTFQPNDPRDPMSFYVYETHAFHLAQSTHEDTTFDIMVQSPSGTAFAEFSYTLMTELGHSPATLSPSSFATETISRTGASTSTHTSNKKLSIDVSQRQQIQEPSLVLNQPPTSPLHSPVESYDMVEPDSPASSGHYSYRTREPDQQSVVNNSVAFSGRSSLRAPASSQPSTQTYEDPYFDDDTGGEYDFDDTDPFETDSYVEEPDTGEHLKQVTSEFFSKMGYWISTNKFVQQYVVRDDRNRARTVFQTEDIWLLGICYSFEAGESTCSLPEMPRIRKISALQAHMLPSRGETRTNDGGALSDNSRDSKRGRERKLGQVFISPNFLSSNDPILDHGILVEGSEGASGRSRSEGRHLEKQREKELAKARKEEKAREKARIKEQDKLLKFKAKISHPHFESNSILHRTKDLPDITGVDFKGPGDVLAHPDTGRRSRSVHGYEKEEQPQAAPSDFTAGPGESRLNVIRRMQSISILPKAPTAAPDRPGQKKSALDQHAHVLSDRTHQPRSQSISNVSIFSQRSTGTLSVSSHEVPASRVRPSSPLPSSLKTSVSIHEALAVGPKPIIMSKLPQSSLTQKKLPDLPPAGLDDIPDILSYSNRDQGLHDLDGLDITIPVHVPSIPDKAFVEPIPSSPTGSISSRRRMTISSVFTKDPKPQSVSGIAAFKNLVNASKASLRPKTESATSLSRPQSPKASGPTAPTITFGPQPTTGREGSSHSKRAGVTKNMQHWFERQLSSSNNLHQQFLAATDEPVPNLPKDVTLSPPASPFPVRTADNFTDSLDERLSNRRIAKGTTSIANPIALPPLLPESPSETFVLLYQGQDTPHLSLDRSHDGSTLVSVTGSDDQTAHSIPVSQPFPGSQTDINSIQKGNHRLFEQLAAFSNEKDERLSDLASEWESLWPSKKDQDSLSSNSNPVRDASGFVHVQKAKDTTLPFKNYDELASSDRERIRKIGSAYVKIKGPRPEIVAPQAKVPATFRGPVFQEEPAEEEPLARSSGGSTASVEEKPSSAKSRMPNSAIKVLTAMPLEASPSSPTPSLGRSWRPASPRSQSPRQSLAQVSSSASASSSSASALPGSETKEDAFIDEGRTPHIDMSSRINGYPLPSHSSANHTTLEKSRSAFNLTTNQSTLLQFTEDFQSRLWFTYRKDLHRIEPSAFTSDAGWGCMIRTGQSLLAQAFIHVFLGREWRMQFSPSEDDAQKYRMILGWFADEPDRYYSIHNIARQGQALEKRIGEWFGPSTVAHALQRLSKKHADCPVTIMVSMDNTIRASDVAQSATGGVGGFSSVGTNGSGIGLEHWKPVVLLIPSRYGSDKLYEKYTANLKGLYKLPQFLGIAGGRPGRSLYFVATQGNELFYFDPHFPRTRASQDELSRYPAKSFHCDVVRAMDIMELDPSMMLGFLIRSSSDLANLSMRLKTDMEKGYPLLTILEDIPLSIPVEPIQDVKLVPSEPVAVVKAERHTLLPSRAAIPRSVTPPAILQRARIVDYELLRGSVDQAFSRPTLDQEEQVRRYVETEPAIARSFIQRIPTSNLATDSTVDQAVTEDLRHKNEMHAIREEREFDAIIETTVVDDHHADSKIGGSTDSSTLALPNSLYDDQHSDLEVSDELELNFEMTTTLSIDDQSTFEILDGKHTTAPSAQIRLEDAERHDLESIQEAVEADSTLGAIISLDHTEQQVDGNVYSDALTNVVQEQGHSGDEMVLKFNVESAASVIDNPETESHDRAETPTPIISGTLEDEEQHSECDAQISPGTDSAAFLTTVLDVVTVVGTDNHLDPEHNVDTSALTQQASGSEDVNEIMTATSLGYSHDVDEDTTLPKLSTELSDRLSRDDLQQREEEEVGEAEKSIDFMTTTTTGDQSEIEIGTLVDAESSVQPDPFNGIGSQPRLDAHGEDMLPSDMDSHSFTIGLSEREHENTSTTIPPHHSFADDEFEPTTTGATFNSNYLQAESEEDLSTQPTDRENMADPTLPIDVAMDIDATQYHKEEAEEDEEDEENILEMDASANIIHGLQSRVSHSAEQKIPDLMISESDVAPLTQVSSEDSTQDTFVSSLQPLVDVSKLQGEDQMVDTGSLSLHSLLPSFDAPEKYVAASLSSVIPKIQAEPAPGNFYDAFESFFAADINLTAPDSLTAPTATKDYALENPVTTESSDPISAVELQDVVHKYGGQTFYDEFESADSDLQSDTQDYNLQAYYSEVEPMAAAPDVLQECLGDSQGVAYMEDGSKLIPYSSEDAYDEQNLDVSASLPESVNDAFAVVGLPVLKESEPFSRSETDESEQDLTSVLTTVLDNSLRNNDATDAVSDQAEDNFELPTQTTMDSESRFGPISFAANEELLGYSSSQDAAYEWPGSLVKQELQGHDFLPDEPIIQDDIAATVSEKSLIFDHDGAESNDSVKPALEPQPTGHQSMESLGQCGIEDEADYEDVLDEFGAEYEGESESEDIGDVTVMLDSTMGLHLPESPDVSQEFSHHGEQGLHQEIDADLDTTDAAFGSDYELGAELASSSNYLDVDMLSMLDDYLNEGDLDAPDAISTTFAEATPTDSKGSDSHSPIGAFVDILPQESFLHNGHSGSMDDDYPQDSTNVDFQHMDNHFCQVNDDDCRESTNNDDPQSTHHDHHPQTMDDGQQADALDITVVLEVVGSAESMDESSANIDVSERKDNVANAEFKHYSEIASTNPEETEGKLIEQPAEDNTLAEADLNLGTTIENLVHYEDESKQDLITLIDKPAVFEATHVQGIEKGEWSGEDAGSFTESLATSEVAPDQEREGDKDVVEFVESLEVLDVAPVQERNEVDGDVTASTESLAISEMALAQEKDEGDEDIIALPEILATLKVAPTQERNESSDDVTASTEILAISEAAPIQERDEGDEDVTARMEIIALPEILATSEVAPAQEGYEGEEDVPALPEILATSEVAPAQEGIEDDEDITVLPDILALPEIFGTPEVAPAQEGYEGDEDVPALAEIIATSEVAPVQEGYESDEVDEDVPAPTEILATSEVAPAQEGIEDDEDITVLPDILALPEIFGTPEVAPAQEGYEGDEDVPALAEIIATSEVAPVQERYEGDEVDEDVLAPTEILATSEVAPAQEEDEGDEDMTAFPDILALPEIFGTLEVAPVQEGYESDEDVPALTEIITTSEVAPAEDGVEGDTDVAASTELVAISNVAPASEEDEVVVEDFDALTENLANLDTEQRHTRDECKEDTSASKDVPITSEVIPVYGREQGDEDASASIDASTDPDEQSTVARKDVLVKSEANPMDTTTTGTDSPIVQATAENDKNRSNEAPGDTVDDEMNTEAVRADAGDSENGPEAASMSGTATPPVRESQVQLRQSPEVRSSPEARSSSSPEARSSSSPEARSSPRQGNKGQKRKQKGKGKNKKY